MTFLFVVDGDNISAKDLEYYLNHYEIDDVVEKIVYGDLLRTEAKQWNNFCIKNNFTFKHCPRMKKNKNITDLHMFIDSSEKLFKMNYSGIIICTNDGDFSILANLWIKYQKKVIFLSNKNHSQFLDFFTIVYLEGDDEDESESESYSSEKESETDLNKKPDLSNYPFLKNIIEDGIKRTIKTRKTWDKLVKKTYPEFVLEDFGFESYIDLYQKYYSKK
jgi:uncharacterized LabA/DUF88 family protein